MKKCFQTRISSLLSDYHTIGRPRLGVMNRNGLVRNAAMNTQESFCDIDCWELKFSNVIRSFPSKLPAGGMPRSCHHQIQSWLC